MQWHLLEQAKEREHAFGSELVLKYESIDQARHESVWDDEARKDLRAFLVAQRERSEYETILIRKKAEQAAN